MKKERNTLVNKIHSSMWADLINLLTGTGHIDLFHSMHRTRCAIEGCCFGFEGVDKEPREYCIWCGRERPFNLFYGVTAPDLLEGYKIVKQEGGKNE